MPEPHDVVHDTARIARNHAHEVRRETVPNHAVFSRRVDGDAERRAERLRAVGTDLDDAIAATDRHDWAVVLEAVRMIQGKAVVTRATLERRLGPGTVGVDLPPLVRAIRAVGLLIDPGEVDSLPPDELRVRMHAVLETLDHELQVFLLATD